MDDESAAEDIAKHFSSISQEYPPIDAEALPVRVKEKIFAPNVMEKAPFLQEHEVYEKLRKRKPKNSSIPGDIP